MPTIRIDDEVWGWLKANAEPFADMPNSVLRRLMGLDASEQSMATTETTTKTGRSVRTNSGRRLNDEWKVGARQARYHKDGTFYEHLEEFPGALFDAHGYVVFPTEEAYGSAPGLHHGMKLNVPDGIASLHGYVEKSK